MKLDLLQTVFRGGLSEVRELSALGKRRLFARVGRTPALVRWLALVAILAGVGARLVSERPSSSNMALDALVTASGNCHWPPEYEHEPVEPRRLTDGRKQRAYDACTTVSVKPWFRFDLRRTVVAERVVVSGRHDCCWLHNTLPLVALASEDGKDFRQIAVRTVPFTRDEPWVIELSPSETFRYLRLTVESAAASEIVLSEVEVFGRPQSVAP